MLFWALGSRKDMRFSAWAVLGCLVSCCFPTPSSAQKAELTGFIGYARTDERDLGLVGDEEAPLRMENGGRYGVRASVNTGIFYGHEVTYAYQRGGLSIGREDAGRAGLHNYAYNFVAHVSPRAVSVRPFLTVGAGGVTFRPRRDGVFEDASSATKFGFNWGGGVKIRLSARTGFRFDIRDTISERPNFLDLPGVSGIWRNVEYSFGYSLLF